MGETAAILVIMTLAGMVQGAAGFGFGLVAIAVLSLLIDIRDASVMLVLASLSMNIFIFWRLHTHFKRDRVMPMIVSAVLGVPLGVWLLVEADPIVLRRILGAVLILTVVQGLIPALAKRRWHPLYVGVPCGVFSGAFSGAFATGGPPAVAYVASQNFDRFRYSATLQLVLGTSAIARILCLGFSGMFTRRILTLSVSGVACTVLGAWLGLSVLKRLSDKKLKKGILGLLAVLGIKYLLA